MVEALQKYFGIRFKAENMNIKHLPLYMTHGRKMFSLSAYGVSFVVVELPEDVSFGVVALEKQLDKYREMTGMHVAFAFKILTRSQREALIGRGIPFICIPDQVFLPFAGIILSDHFKKALAPPVDKLMPATQSLLLFMLYSNEDKVLKKDAAEKLGLTRTSITRASEQLYTLGIIDQEQMGTSIFMRLCVSKREAFEKARPYMIDPVQKTEYVKSNKALRNLIIAGESALSHRTMLGRPTIDVYAVFKGDKDIAQLETVDPKWSDDECIKIELWKYDPAMFSNDGYADVASLCKSLENSEDERVQGELNDLLEEYKW